MGIFKDILKQLFKEGFIEHKQMISDSAYELTIKSESIKTAEFIPGYFLRVVIGLTQEGLSRPDFVRSYSAWDVNKNSGTLKLAVATHSDGAGANWAREVKPGDKVYFTWKKGNFLVDENADSYLMIGDLSALSHLYIVRRNLSNKKQVESIIYSRYKQDLYADVDGTTPFDFYELPENSIEEITNIVKEILPTMTGRKMVYVGGDSRVCVALNKYFKNELQWEAKQIKTKPFWNPDKKGLE